MIRLLSLPTWFMSLSAADTRWTDLLKMLARLNNGLDYSDKDIEGQIWQEKTRLVQKDPVTCSRYFDHRVQEFLNTILRSDYEPIGKLRDVFYRVEFQQRGSPHIHMLVWTENAPTLEKNSEEEIVQFVDHTSPVVLLQKTLLILWNSSHINIQGPVERKEEQFVDLAFLCLLGLNHVVVPTRGKSRNVQKEVHRSSKSNE